MEGRFPVSLALPGGIAQSSTPSQPLLRPLAVCSSWCSEPSPHVIIVIFSSIAFYHPSTSLRLQGRGGSMRWEDTETCRAGPARSPQSPHNQPHLTRSQPFLKLPTPPPGSPDPRASGPCGPAWCHCACGEGAAGPQLLPWTQERTVVGAVGGQRRSCSGDLCPAHSGIQRPQRCALNRHRLAPAA